jgi:hypothetical protein
VLRVESVQWALVACSLSLREHYILLNYFGAAFGPLVKVDQRAHTAWTGCVPGLLPGCLVNLHQPSAGALAEALKGGMTNERVFSLNEPRAESREQQARSCTSACHSFSRARTPVGIQADR